MCAFPHYTGARLDFVDLRDYIYTPGLAALPAEHLPWDLLLPEGGEALAVRNQLAEGTCVGQALAALIDLQLRLRATPAAGHVSAEMLYRMARYHDMASEDQGSGVSSLRSAIKGFFHHGACLDAAWPDGDARDWPDDQQALAATEHTLGAYSRLQPILHHYHSAIQEAGAVLVTAAIHDGWISPDAEGLIAPPPPEDGPKPLRHAFLIVGYNRRGFLVLNSWGRDWGGVPIPARGTTAPGMAIWPYADWARNIADGWVLRLGVPGQEAFAVSTQAQGLTPEGGRTASMPYRALRGHVLSLKEGRWQTQGAYATPERAVQGTEERLRQALAQSDCQGLVLAFPGIMMDEAASWRKALRLKNLLQFRKLDLLTCFWCADFSADMIAVMGNIFERCRAQSGGPGEERDRLFEARAQGAGRAFWREINRHAYCAALPCDPEAGMWRNDPGCAGDRGVLGDLLERLGRECARQGKGLHLLAEGAGALVVDALLRRAQGRDGDSDPLAWMPGLASLSLSFPAVPMSQAGERILKLADALNAAAPGSAQILLPSEQLERRLTTQGYGGSILKLVTRSFLDGREPMLGSWEQGAAKAAPPFQVFPPSPTPEDGPAQSPAQSPAPNLARINVDEIESDPGAEAQSLLPLLAHSKPVKPLTNAQERDMNSSDFPALTLEQLQAKINDGSLTPEDTRHYLMLDKKASTPFAPVLVVNPDLVRVPPGARSALALNSANAAARLLRQAAYMTKLGQGYDGPRLAAEGDSWFQYPLRLFDVIDYAMDHYAVFDTSAAGDLLENMARSREYIAALRRSEAEILLLSAGGNDVCAGGKLADFLETYDPDHPDLKPGDYLKRGYQAVMDNAIAAYERICRDVNREFPGVTIVVHGYDYVIPNGGRWLGGPMESRGIADRKLQRRIAAEMIDQFNRALRRMARDLGHVAYVDCRGAVADADWFDELHPTSKGFAAVSSRILTTVKQILAQRPPRVTRDLAPAREIQRTPQALAGRRNAARSLHIGLNSFDPAHYAGQNGQLYGCENDARAMRDLAQAQGYEPTVLLTKDATREAVISELRRAARDLQPGDQFLFTNACHGAQISDLNGDEKDYGSNTRRDSTLCLFDSQMIDDELWHVLSEFREGVRITMVADSCHSGTVIRAAPVPSLLIDAEPLPAVTRFRGLSDRLARQIESEN
ncbi:MAG: caspase family protein [Paracoccus sp. (in: a-proteobacteria)]|uniref:GDSL-type esterase/lipase family protein n=1 Tax=Paracoccus sp. TaxID=267 RepID=UPI0039E2FF69